MGPLPRELCFCAPWAWGIGDQSMPNIWRLENIMERAEQGGNGGDGLGFSLRFDPTRAGFDRTLLSFPVSAMFSCFLGWSKNSSQRRLQGSMMITEGGRESAAAVAIVAAAVALYFAAIFVPDQQQPHRPRRRRLAASALSRPNLAAWPRDLPAPDDGLRILSSNDESLENVIHGTSIGAGDEEPVLVARVEIKPTDVAAGANADGETEKDSSEKETEEVERLKELWLSLLEREQRLELRLMELDGIREQEATVRELENSVAVAAVEARLLELKASSLQEENERLRAQVSELDAVRAELGRAREKLRALKARVQGEEEEAVLRERVTELEKNGEERASMLAEEVATLRTANAGLEEENMELALRLQDAEQVASSVNLVLQEDIAEEANYLRETNEGLTRKIEQLHGDHCAHVEELVYLKWVNACLRYELRGGHDHHAQEEQGGAGGSSNARSAMDLSKSMSYRSSEKAKELMLKYGSLGLDGLDHGLFSPLREPLYGDGDDEGHQPRGDEDQQGRSPDMSVTMAAATTAPGKRAGHGKLKFLGNIKKLLASSRRGHGHRGDRKSKKAPPSDEHLEKAMRWLSTQYALDGDHSYESTPLSSCERTPQSSATTVDSHARGGGGGERRETAPEAAASRLEAETARSKSDAGGSYGRGASRYHALRPDRPAGVAPDVFNAPEKLRRHSDELRSS